MKKALLIFTLTLTVTAVHAQTPAPVYIEIRKVYHRIELVHVSRPGDLRKWYYDVSNNTYYRFYSRVGVALKMTVR